MSKVIVLKPIQVLTRLKKKPAFAIVIFPGRPKEKIKQWVVLYGGMEAGAKK